jgi:RHS repeat-associated protein
VYYLHNDHLGAPRRATDENGVVMWAWQGDAFGNTLPDEDPDNDGMATEVNLRFPGQYYDGETGLHYNWHRYYEPSAGRYLTADPLGVVPDHTATLSNLNHLYVYANNNPVNLTDPYGLLPVMPWPWPNGGPFGSVCGPADNPGLATWIPDIYGRACEIHDKCYEDCSKTKQQCDEEFRWIVGGGLGRVYDYGATRTDKSQEQFDKAREKCKCQ